MSSHTLNDPHTDTHMLLRLQYENTLKDDAISKATTLIQQLQEEVHTLKQHNQHLHQDLLHKALDTQRLHTQHSQLETKITFLQECLVEKDKQIQHLEDRLTFKKNQVEKKFNNYLTISYQPKHINQLHDKTFLNHSDFMARSPATSTAKKYGMSTSPDQDNGDRTDKIFNLSKEMIELRRDLQMKDKQNLYLLKKNKAINDYISVIEDINARPLLRRETPKIGRGFLL